MKIKHLINVWRRKWQPTPVFLPGESHGQRNLVGYNPGGRKELGRTEPERLNHIQCYCDISFFVHPSPVTLCTYLIAHRISRTWQAFTYLVTLHYKM